MAFPTITEQYGSRSATGFKKEASFGVPLTPDTFLPMTSNTMEEEPGWFSPHLMQGLRDLQVYNLYGEAKYHGAITGPIFPSNAIEVLAAAIGEDAAAGYGVYGTIATPTSTTLSGSTLAGATSITVTSATGFVVGQEVIVDTGYNQETRKITVVATNVLTLADPLNYPHLTGVTVVTGTTTTLAAAVTAPTTTITVTSATGITTGTMLQIDVNSPSGVTTSEVRKVATVVTTTVTLDSNLTYNHASGAQVIIVTSPYTHTISEANTLPSLTVEKNLGSFQSLQFAGCRVNKFDLKMPTGNNPAEMTTDMIGQSVATLTTPTAVTVANESPFVFAEANLTIFGTLRTEVHNVGVTVENGLKETYTYSGNHGPSFITPVTLHALGTIDLVWSSLTDATYGDFTRMHSGVTASGPTLGQLQFALEHPASGGTIVFYMPQIVLNKYANDVKMEDVILSTMGYEATRPLSGSNLFTIQVTVTNSAYLPY